MNTLLAQLIVRTIKYKDTFRYYKNYLLKDKEAGGPDFHDAVIDCCHIKVEDKALLYFPRFMASLKNYIDTYLMIAYDLSDGCNSLSLYVKQIFVHYLAASPLEDQMTLARQFPRYLEGVFKKLNLGRVISYYLDKPVFREKYLRYCKDYVQGKVDAVVLTEDPESKLVHEHFPKIYTAYMEVVGQWCILQRNKMEITVEGSLIQKDFNNIIIELTSDEMVREVQYKSLDQQFPDVLKDMVLVMGEKRKLDHCEGKINK